MSRWDYWIEEPIFVNAGVTKIDTRKNAIYTFVSDGIVPMLQRAGYRLVYSNKEITGILLRILLTLHDGKSVNPVQRDDDPYEDHYILYNHHLDSFVWERFWKRWDGFQEFEEGKPGYKLRFTLPDFLWSWVDLERSPTAIKLEKELQEIELQEEFSKGKDDPYLQESMRRDYQDRHW